MASRIQHITIAVSALIASRIVFGFVLDPMHDVRADLERELAQVPVGVGRGDAQNDFAAIQNNLAAKPSLWRELVPAQEVPSEAPDAAPSLKAPDLAALLKDVSVGRGQIGANKIRLHTPNAPNGEWVAVGAVINGCTLASFTPENVTFTHRWKEGGKELSIALPRP
jgi:hypothetical protein